MVVNSFSSGCSKTSISNQAAAGFLKKRRIIIDTSLLKD